MRGRDWVAAIALATVCTTAGAAAAPPFVVPVERKNELQQLLDQHGAIQLAADTDYRSAALRTLTVSSGQRIEGGWNTRLPQIVVPGGVSGVFIAGVRSDAAAGPDVVFTGGAPNDDVEIVGGTGGPGTNIHVRIREGAKVNRLKLSEYGGLEIQQSVAGYVRDSVFTRLLGYWPGPQVFWRGNVAEPSGGNAFLGIASITPGKGSYWRDVGDVWFVGWDCESWNGASNGSPRCFTVEGAGRVVSIGLSGGLGNPATAGALARFKGSTSLLSWFHHGSGGRLDGVDEIHENVGTVISLQNLDGMRMRDEAVPASGERMQLLAPFATLGQATTKPGVQLLNQSQSAALTSALFIPSSLQGRRKPQRRVISDALGNAWRSTLAAQADSAARIQAEIDARGLVRLPRGTYYLDRPLKIGSRTRTEGLLGADRDAVVLVAKGDFAVIEGRGDFHFITDQSDGATIRVVLDQLTLYGGRYGISWTAAPGNLGNGGTIAFSSFTRLKFMKQRMAGVNAEGIYGIDSNLWYQTDFSDMPVAFRGDGRTPAQAGGINYADKQHFLDNQYQNISDTVWYWTSNRWSGGHLWTDNYFFNVGRISQTRGAINLLWTNSVMDNVIGDVAMHVVDDGSTATYLFYMVDCVWRGNGPTVVTDTQSGAVGTLFVNTEFAQTGGSLVASHGEQTLFAWGSRITGTAVLGKMRHGALIDSSVGDLPFAAASTASRVVWPPR